MEDKVRITGMGIVKIRGLINGLDEKIKHPKFTAEQFAHDTVITLSHLPIHDAQNRRTAIEILKHCAINENNGAKKIALTALRKFS